MSCSTARERSIFLRPNDSVAPPTGLEYRWYLAAGDVPSISAAAALRNHRADDAKRRIPTATVAVIYSCLFRSFSFFLL